MNRSEERWLVVGSHDPYHARNGSALRIRQHIKMLQREVADVLYWRPEPFTPWANLSKLGKILLSPRLLLGFSIGVDPNANFLFSWKQAKRLDNAIRVFEPTHVLWCESWMHLYRENLNGGYGFWFRDVVDLHNVEGRLRDEVAVTKKGFARIVEKARGAIMREVEWTLSIDVDEVWVCSLDDKLFVERQGFLAPVKVVPNRIDHSFYSKVRREGIRSFGMVGIWSYSPNAGAADRLLLEIWPEVGKSVPILVGKNPTATMMEAAGRGAVVTGEVDDVRPMLGKIRTMVIPLTEGGGTRTKVLEAFASGIPVIATAKAVEGLEVEHMKHCVIARPEEMAQWIRKLWDSPGIEAHLRQHALVLVKEKYSYA